METTRRNTPAALLLALLLTASFLRVETFTFDHHPGYPYPPFSVNWRAIARCESGLRWHVSTGNGYYGGLQFALSTWLGYGGRRFDYWPHHATPYEQRVIAERVLRGQGIGAWPYCGRFG